MLLISKTDRSILALLSAYHEYLVTFKLMTSQVVQRARALRALHEPLAVKELKNWSQKMTKKTLP